MGKKRLFAGILLFCLVSLMVFTDRQTFYADKTGDFTGDVKVLKAGDDTYVLQVQVKNTGVDFEGTVRLAFSNVDSGCVFDTRLTLPKDGQKQFTLTVPRENADSVRGSGSLVFLDMDENELQKVPFKNIFKGQSIGFSVGILSDHYDRLTYMDMGGNGYEIGNISQPVNLVDLDGNTLKDSLDGLHFLVIDSYNVSTLDKESIKAVENWVDKGGGLIIGTGERGEDILNAFDEDFTGLTLSDVSEPGEDNYLVSGGQRYYDYYEQDGIDFRKMAVAQLQPSGNKYSANCQEAGNNPGIIRTYGDGSILVLAFSLCEDEMQKAPSEICQVIYDEAMNFSSIATDYYVDSYYEQMQAFHLIDSENTDVNFTWLEVLIFVYVVLVGPVLYLILAKAKKREWYWIGAPVLALVFIGGVLVFGRELRMKDTRVYSVTAQRVDGKEKGKTDTFYSAYHSGVKPWKLRLKNQYEYAGTRMDWGYYGGSGYWKYRVVYGDGIELGMKPESNFETGFLFASGNNGEDCGEILAQELAVSETLQKGSITNNTEYDFPYMMVVTDDYLMIFTDVKKGETIEIAKAVKDGRVVYQSTDIYMNDLYYNYQGMSSAIKADDETDTQSCAALVVGMFNAKRKMKYGAGQTLICGVVPDYEKTVADKCTEISFGCPYAIVEQEVSGASN